MDGFFFINSIKWNGLHYFNLLTELIDDSDFTQAFLLKFRTSLHFNEKNCASSLGLLCAYQKYLLSDKVEVIVNYTFITVEWRWVLPYYIMAFEMHTNCFPCNLAHLLTRYYLLGCSGQLINYYTNLQMVQISASVCTWNLLLLFLKIFSTSRYKNLLLHLFERRFCYIRQLRPWLIAYLCRSCQ